MSSTRYLLLITLLLLLAACNPQPPVAQPTEIIPPTSQPLAEGPAGWQSYANQRFGFSLRVPPEAQINKVDENNARIDLPIAAGTNLVAKYLEISVVEGAASCPSAYGALVESGEQTINGISFLHESGAGVAAGNLYEWESYSTIQPGNPNCLNLTFVLHSANIDNYPTPPASFDPLSESAVFPEILSTFRWATP